MTTLWASGKALFKDISKVQNIANYIYLELNTIYRINDHNDMLNLPYPGSMFTIGT